MKPGNILIAEDGRAKLADLGVAKLLSDAADLTSLDQGIGTPFYMPWEQTLNASLVDPRSDLFALGATFYHLITGRVPYPGKTVQDVGKAKDEGSFAAVRELDPKLPRSVDTIIAKMLARMPKDRFQNASQLIDVLAASGLADEKTEPSPLADTDLPPAKTRPGPEGRPGQGPAGRRRARRGLVRPIPPARRGLAADAGTAADIGRWFEEGLTPGRVLRDPERREDVPPLPHRRPSSSTSNGGRRPRPRPRPAAGGSGFCDGYRLSAVGYLQQPITFRLHSHFRFRPRADGRQPIAPQACPNPNPNPPPTAGCASSWPPSSGA